MEAERFDAAARSVWRAISRRGLLRGFAGGLAILGAFGSRSRVLAQQYEASPSVGLACSDDSQCETTSGQTVICADNGVADGVPLSCCVSGGFCSSDADCCGVQLCVAGYEWQTCMYPGTYSTLVPGDPCTATSECPGNVPGYIWACGTVGGVSVCCGDEGNSCFEDTLCCDGLVCRNGGQGDRCLPPVETGLAVGAACTADAECSQARAATACRETGEGSTCCRLDNQPIARGGALSGGCCPPLQAVDRYCRYD